MNYEGVVVVTGANRGIGRALVSEMRNLGQSVIATYRREKDSRGLLKQADQDSGVMPIQLDVRSDESVEEFARSCGSLVDHVDFLVNNAGLPASQGSILEAPISDLEDHAQTHAIGMVRVTKALLPLFAQGSVVANISSMLSSIRGIGCSWTHYGPAKSFQNALTVQLANCLRPRGVVVMAVHPGWVATKIGGSGAPLLPTDSARAVANILLNASLADTSTFVDYRGGVLSW